MYSNGISRRLIRYLFAESQGFLLRKRYAITNPSGFSSRLSSHEGPKACASGPSLRKDRDSNPGCPQGHNGFRDRPDRPLRHLSVYHTRCTCRFVGAKVLNDFDVCNIRTCISKLFFLTATPNGPMLALFACLRMPLYDYLIRGHVTITPPATAFCDRGGGKRYVRNLSHILSDMCDSIS